MSWTPHALCLLLLAAPALHGAEVSTSVSQGVNSSTKINFSMTNNDPGAIYNSAELRLEATIGAVLSAILSRNPAVAGMTTADLISTGRIFGSIQPTEVGFSGWNNSFNPSSAVVSLTNVGGFPDFDYTTWQNTLANPAQDTMVFTLNLGQANATDPRLKNLLDFNGNGQVDAEEHVITLPALAAAPAEPAAGFVGIIDAFNHYPGAVDRFAVAGDWLERGAAAAALGVQRSGSDATLTWQAQHGLAYELQTSLTLTANPADWTPLTTQQRPATTGPALAPQTHTHSGAFAVSARFYRLRITVLP